MSTTERVNLICQSCAELNGGKWRNEKVHADVMLGKCQVCKKLTIITNIHYYKDIHSEMRLVAPTTESKKNADTSQNLNLDTIITIADGIHNSNSDNLNLDLDSDSDLTLNVNANRKTSNKPKNKVLT